MRSISVWCPFCIRSVSVLYPFCTRSVRVLVPVLYPFRSRSQTRSRAPRLTYLAAVLRDIVVVRRMRPRYMLLAMLTIYFYTCMWFCSYSYGALFGGPLGHQSSAMMRKCCINVSFVPLSV